MSAFRDFGEILEERTKVVASHARLTRRIEAWDEPMRERYTRMCADRAHELTSTASPSFEDWEAVIEPSIPEGPALLGFVAARIAEEIDGPEAYHTEPARQTEWLVAELGLSPYAGRHGASDMVSQMRSRSSIPSMSMACA